MRLSSKWRVTIAVFLLAFVNASVAQTPAPERDWSKEKARPVVEWARKGVVYEIWERAFSPAGDFNGITARLDDLQKTGVTILWLMPVNPIGRKNKKGSIGSPYAVRDYMAVNPAYGTPADLKRLVREAHARKMKVVVDVVFNHSAWDNLLITQHPEWYVHDSAGKITYPHDWTDVAKLDYSKPGLRRYMTDVLKYWLREYDLDGFRCDVAADVPTDFWEAARAELEKIKPDIYMLAEADKPEQMVKAFDSDYSWGLMHAINDAFQATKPATVIREEWEKERVRFPQGTVHLRIADDHDELRLIGRVGEKAALAAQALVFTLDGIPLVYNGMEVGDTAESADPALFEKVPITWGIANKRPAFPRFYQAMCELRHDSFLADAELVWLHNSDEQHAISFLRHEEGEDDLIVVVNASGVTEKISVTGVASEKKLADVTGLFAGDRESWCKKEQPPVSLRDIALQPWQFRILTPESWGLAMACK